MANSRRLGNEHVADALQCDIHGCQTLARRRCIQLAGDAIA